MKKVILILLALAFVATGITVAAIAMNSDTNVDPADASEEPVAKPMTEWVAPEVPFADLKDYQATFEQLNVYPFEQLDRSWLAGCIYFSHPDWLMQKSDYAGTISSFDNELPIQKVCSIDEDHLCVVYKVYRDKTDEMLYAYLSFEKLPGDTEDGFGNWFYYGDMFYVKDVLTRDAFADLTVGKKISNEEWAALDPSQCGWGQSLLAPDDLKGEIKLASAVERRCRYIMLNEGILYVEAKRVEDSDDALVITEVEFYPYGVRPESGVYMPFLAEGFVPEFP